ncbi:hypothetical protein [Pseudomonas sp. KNUC1026]|uniref:hypothetical protein n=1 Tax=Pseudomonas sp. KNUC1026 TaxID=2893890 RepID=UPI003FA6E3F3
MAKLIPGRNPLALIAIFAGTIEASALASLPMLKVRKNKFMSGFWLDFHHSLHFCFLLL